VVVLALLTVAVEQPINVLLDYVLGRAGAAEFRFRWPNLAQELQRRVVAESVIANISTDGLVQVIAAMQKKPVQVSQASSAGSWIVPRHQISLADSDPTTSDSNKASISGAHLGDLLPGRLRRSSTKPEFIIGGTAVGAVQRASMQSTTAVNPEVQHTSPDRRDSRRHDGVPDRGARIVSNATYEYDWIDPPTWMQRGCPCILHCFGRHSTQKPGYLRTKKHSEQQVVSAIKRSDATEADVLRQLRRNMDSVSTATSAKSFDPIDLLVDSLAFAWTKVVDDCTRCTRCCGPPGTADNNGNGGGRRRRNPSCMRECVRWPCTSQATIAFAVFYGYSAFCILYLMLFGTYQPAYAAKSFIT
jgi:hypothetical protein